MSHRPPPTPSHRRRLRNAARIGAVALVLLAVATAAARGDAAPPLPDDVARVHYQRPDGDYAGWVLHVWEDTTESVTWAAGLPVTGQDAYGAYWDVGLADGAARVGFIVHKGDEKDPGPDQFLDLAALGNEAWILSGNATVFGARPDVREVGGGDLRARRAHWVARDLILWDVGVPLAGATYRLHHADTGGLALDDGAVTGGAALGLRLEPDGPTADALARFPHLTGMTALRVPADALAWVRTLLRGQVAVSMTDAEGAVLDATGLQIAGVLDDLFATDAPLGVHWDGDQPTVAVWAPTARVVRFVLFDADSERVLPMRRDHGTGVWSIVGEPTWRDRDYLFEVEVYAPTTDRIETNRVTDPYSLSLRANSARSQIVDLGDPALMPDGWSTWVKPAFSDPVDAVVYELHVRDFSATDATVPTELRGTYAAFGLEGTAGVAHLTALADAGVTHLHLLPTFDLATIDEDRSTWAEPDLGPDGRPTAALAAQQAVEAVRDRDGFNWGYDPWHYLVPEGSYALEPDGPSRVREFRELVMAADGMGLRVVVDVVFNHTNAAGQGAKSVLDRIVPGYYHRLDEAGNVTTSTCCPNTATEHAMMERLMLDAVALWARAYKVDGYRFDLMGHHMVANMRNVRAVLDALTAQADGTHGASLLLYGEGWDFGEVAQNARGVNATQANLAGSGIGTFSDRLRDAVRGGGPFDSGEALVRTQGFATGLGTLPNATTARLDPEAQADAARRAADLVRVGLAGNLAAVTFVGADGALVRGDEVDYNGQPAGYGRVPQDHVVYVSKHDNQTLWDIAAYKLPLDLSTDDRVRAHVLALSTVLYAQGMPFLHAGSDLLRSKSLDRNSYDSGDAFNAIDWTGATTTMGLGLPLAADNRESWGVMRDRLENPLLQPGADDVAFATAAVQDMLRVRSGTPLFRLRSADDVLARIAFHHTGVDATPGVIVLELRDDLDGFADLDPAVDRVVVVFNASPERVNLAIPDAAGRYWRVHEALREGADAEVLRGAAIYAGSGRATVPAWTTAVFVAPAAAR